MNKAKLLSASRTSEFWIGLAAAVGGVLVGAGVVTQEQYNTIAQNAPLVYVVARVLSKMVKKGGATVAAPSQVNNGGSGA